MGDDDRSASLRPDGAIAGVRHDWTFDDMFSAFAVQGSEQETNDAYTREELAPLAKVNVSRSRNTATSRTRR